MLRGDNGRVKIELDEEGDVGVGMEVGDKSRELEGAGGLAGMAYERVEIGRHAGLNTIEAEERAELGEST